MGCHRHRRDRREAEDPIGPMLLDRVHVSGSDQLIDFGPGGPDEPALSPCTLVTAARLRIADDRRPGIDRVVVQQAGSTIGLEEDPSHVRVAHPRWRVGVPGEGCPARAAARLVLGAIGTDGRVVGLLRLPGDDAVLDVHLPGARPGAVHAVRAAYHLVMTPAVPVEDVALAAADLGDGAQVLRHLAGSEESSGPNQELLGCIACCCLHGSFPSGTRSTALMVRAGTRSERERCA